MSERERPTAGGAVGILAQLTLTRLLRGKLLWFLCIAAGLPSLVGVAMSQSSRSSPLEVAHATLATVQFLFAILPPILIGASVGDELGAKTATYLWSRPVPRWTILAGKLVVLAPLTGALLAASWGAALGLGHGLVSAQALAAVFAGGLAVSALVAAIATIGTRHGIAFSLLYVLLLDLPMGALPVSVNQLSVIHQTSVLAGLPAANGEAADPTTSPLVAALWLAAMSVVWLGFAFRRLRAREV